ncbi:MAG: methylenetetrahydrofolate reductase, partial [Clostridia bacterium]|nr:methylenetetrahydrofolate reductase [Clostridia bacterium]
MKITQIINGKKPSLSFEVFPPKTSDKFESVLSCATNIAKLNPSFMSVTYGAGGGTSLYTTNICKELNSLGVTSIAHLTCVSSTKEKIQNELLSLKDNKIENILALRGDLVEGASIEKASYKHASELITEIKKRGDFCVGRACYPEGHPESENMSKVIDGLKYKVDAGCEFLTTQMFFDNNVLYNFLYRLLKAGIKVPVIADGTKYLSDYQANAKLHDTENIKTFSTINEYGAWITGNGATATWANM